MAGVDPLGWVTRRLDRSGLAGRLMALQVVVVALTVAVCTAAALLVADRLAVRGAAAQVLSTAQALARSPDVVAALEDPDPSAVLQPMAEQVRADTDTSFVVVMAPDRTRYSHPNPDLVGGRFEGTVEPALEGRPLTETFEGSLGPSVRAVVPVRGAEEVVGLVSVGITVDRVGDAFRSQLPLMTAGLALALGVAALGTWLVGRRLRRQTFGLGPREIARVYEHHDAVLHAMREGLLVVDPQGHLVLANDEARRLLDLPPDAEGRPVSELGLSSGLVRLVESGSDAMDEVHVAGERLVVVNQQRTAAEGRDLGTVVTLRDQTELGRLTDELGATRTLAESLRAQAHEAATRLHTVITLIELGETDEALRFATSEVAGAQALTDRLVEQVREPALVALLLGKVAEAHERAVTLEISEDTSLAADHADPGDLVTVVGNLVDNAVEATLPQPPPRQVQVSVREDDGSIVVQVRDNGPGLSTAALEHATESGWSTRTVGSGRRFGRGVGMALVQQVARRRGGDVSLANDGGAVVTVRLPVDGRVP